MIEIFVGFVGYTKGETVPERSVSVEKRGRTTARSQGESEDPAGDEMASQRWGRARLVRRLEILPPANSGLPLRARRRPLRVRETVCPGRLTASLTAPSASVGCQRLSTFASLGHGRPSRRRHPARNRNALASLLGPPPTYKACRAQPGYATAQLAPRRRRRTARRAGTGRSRRRLIKFGRLIPVLRDCQCPSSVQSSTPASRKPPHSPSPWPPS